MGMTTGNTDNPGGKPDPSTWVDRYGDYLFAFALQRVHDRSVAEDLVQETLLAGLKSLERFRAASSEKTWLTGILKHKILDHYRKRYRDFPLDDIERFADTAVDDYNAAGGWQNRPARWTEDPMAALEQREFMKVLHQCLGGLSDRLAHAFAMRELDGETTATICKVLNISTTNCWVMLHRARAAMRRCLEMKWLAP
jgi:RNA polymerase sigma-70 factor (ECF subfamily)